MKIFLAVLVMVSYVAGFAALSLKHTHLPTYILPSLVFVVIVNFFCAWYLYLRAPRNKAEWVLFGLIGNINAVVIFWLVEFWVSFSGRIKREL